MERYEKWPATFFGGKWGVKTNYVPDLHEFIAYASALNHTFWHKNSDFHVNKSDLVKKTSLLKVKVFFINLKNTNFLYQNEWCCNK